MITIIRYGSEAEYSQLLLASKSEKKIKQKKCYDTVLLFMGGYERKRISEILHIPHWTVCAHITSYQKGGMDALFLVKQTGAPKKLFDEQEHAFIHIITIQTSKEAGVGIFANWTSSLACKLHKTGLVWHSVTGGCAISLTVLA